MSRKILAFGASNSINSINKKLAAYTANQTEDAAIGRSYLLCLSFIKVFRKNKR